MGPLFAPQRISHGSGVLQQALSEDVLAACVIAHVRSDQGVGLLHFEA